MAWMAAALTVFVIANLAVMYLWFCQRSLEKSLAPHREINLMPDMNKRVPMGTGDGFGSGTSIALAPRYGASAGAGIAAMPTSAPVKAKVTKTKPASKGGKVKTAAKTTGAATVKKAASSNSTGKSNATSKAKSAGKSKVVPAASKTVSKAKADKMDDVSLISGVGPTLKKKLAGAGVTSLKQIAKMSPKKLEALDDELNLGGRCMGEEWIEQAKELVAGKPPRAKIDKAAAKS